MRWTVSLPVPTALAVARMPVPAASISTILVRVRSLIDGRPIALPPGPPISLLRLAPKTYTVVLSAKVKGKRVETKWIFTLDSAGPVATN